MVWAKSALQNNFGTIGKLIQPNELGGGLRNLALEAIASHGGFIGQAVAATIGARFYISKRPDDALAKLEIKDSENPISVIRRVDERYVKSVNSIRS